MIGPYPGPFLHNKSVAVSLAYSKTSIMNSIKTEFVSKYSIAGIVRNFILKLRQNPDIYPIKYYKKTRRLSRSWQGSAVK